MDQNLSTKMSHDFRNYKTYLRPLFEVLAERGAVKRPEATDEVADRVGVTEAERAERYPRSKDKDPIYRNCIAWARQGLVDAGVVVGPDSPTPAKYGVWELNEEGKALARSGHTPESLEETLHQRDLEGRKKRRQERTASMKLAGLDMSSETFDDADDDDIQPDSEDSIDPILVATSTDIRRLVDRENEPVTTTMLGHVRGMNDREFEYLVGNVLKEALKAEAVTITQKSRDGGFDGVLTFDSLGMRIAVFEAKRYGEGNVVGRSIVDAFATAARRRRATHKLFVTSSHFSPEAIEAAKDEGIRLVDGVAFVELMAKHGFGLRVRQQFTLYEADPAWSVGDELEN